MFGANAMPVAHHKMILGENVCTLFFFLQPMHVDLVLSLLSVLMEMLNTWNVSREV
jgi:hypothetical protein